MFNIVLYGVSHSYHFDCGWEKKKKKENYVPYFLSALIVNYIYFSHCVEHFFFLIVFYFNI